MCSSNNVKNLGIYNSLSYGNGGAYRGWDLEHHIKASLGILMPLPDYHNASFDFTAGINYHHIGSPIFVQNRFLDAKIFNPWSFEMGLTVKFHKP